MIKPLLSLLLIASAALSHCADKSTPSASVAESPCAPSAAPFARELVSPANGATNVPPSIGKIEVRLANVPPGAMTLVRFIAPVTLKAAGEPEVQSSALQFSGGSAYSGTLPALISGVRYVVTSSDPSDPSARAIVGCFHT